jgi:hypothetical protein
VVVRILAALLLLAVTSLGEETNEPKLVRVTFNQDFELGRFGFCILSVETGDRLQRGIEPLRTTADRKFIVVTYGLWTLSKETVLKGDAGEMRLRDSKDTIYTPDSDTMAFMRYDWLDQLKPGMKYLERKVFLIPTEIAQSSLRLEIPEPSGYSSQNRVAWIQLEYHSN